LSDFCIQENLCELKEQERIKERIINSLEKEICRTQGKSGGTGLTNSVAPSFPGSAKGGKEIVANISRQIIVDSKSEETKQI
jgi:hypothetical protein